MCNGGGLYFVGIANDLESGVNICDGLWHSIAMTFDGAVMVLYVDNTIVAVSSKSLNTAPLQYFMVAWNGNFGVAGGELFTGTLSDIRVFDVALTAAQIAQIASS